MPLPAISPARLVMAVFFVHAAGFANWVPRIPDVQERLAVGPADLSVALLGMPIGGLVALMVMGAVVDRLTPRRTIIVGLVFLGASLLLPGWAWDVPSLFVSLFLVGLAFPMVDVAMNVEANRIQSAGGRRIISTCHGFWSAGTAIGAVIGSAIAGLGVQPRWHLLVVGLVTIVFALAVPPMLPVLERVATSADRRLRHILTLPTVGMMGACLFAFGMVLVEMVARNWSAVYLHDVFAGSPAEAGFGYAAFAITMAIGRFLGDRLADRWGPVTLARVCCTIAIVGAATIVGAVSLPMAVVGFGLAGLGISVAFPLAVSAVAARGDRPAAMNVAAFSLVISLTSLVAPPLVGLVAEGGGLRLGIATLLPPLLLSMVLTARLAPAPAPATAT
jgi:MFS family permease